MRSVVLDTRQKALAINLDKSIYGTFAEIGAGQEIARHFFIAGGASGTIAKSLSAYDMSMSDYLYGERPGRYVCKARLNQMLDKEFGILMETLALQKPDRRYFAIANTVEAINYDRSNKSHGWLGVKFQTEPGGEPNEVIVHLRLLDRENILQQEILGVLGVNLLYGCYFLNHDPKGILNHMQDNLIPGRMQVDMVHMIGPAFKNVDNRILSLHLVKHGMADACMFLPDGSTIHPTEVLYKKDILALRGRFRPITKVHLDMLKNGLKQFEKERKVVYKDQIVMITELTLNDLSGEKGIEVEDFLSRVEILTALGQTVLISNFKEYYKLVNYLTRYNTGSQISLLLGANSLINIFNERYYDNLQGGLLEAFSQLINKDVRLYLYPYKFGNEIITTKNMIIPDKYKLLYEHLLADKKIIDFENYNEEILDIFSHKVLEKIKEGNTEWEQMVPPIVSRLIKEKNLFNWRNSKFVKTNMLFR
jgi:nicotinic acid mononucleotide adenylyltransferase